jgi:hypothetical protein
MIATEQTSMSARWAGETWTEPATASGPLHFGPAPAERRRAEQSALESLRTRLVTGAVERAEDSHAATALRWAGADAVAIAALCDLPLLVFPELFEEKCREALARARRQRAIWGRTRRVLARTLPERLREFWGAGVHRTGAQGHAAPKSGLILPGRASATA